MIYLRNSSFSTLNISNSLLVHLFQKNRLIFSDYHLKGKAKMCFDCNESRNIIMIKNVFRKNNTENKHRNILNVHEQVRGLK